MPVRDDENTLDRADQERIDDLLAQDRELTLGAADERIAGGMYARIARAHAERKFAASWKWLWQLAIAAFACAALLAVWLAMPKKNVPREASQRAQLPAVAPAAAQVAAQRPVKSAPLQSPARFVPRFHPATAQAAVPRKTTFPINVAPTEQERLLLQLAAHHPEELQTIAAAIEDTKIRAELEKQEFDQWLQQRGGRQ